jgi:hypothetical protein
MKKKKKKKKEEEVPGGTSLPKINYVKYKIEIAIAIVLNGTEQICLHTRYFLCFNSFDAVK